MSDQDFRGWGFQEIGWLLDQVEAEGGTIPARYRHQDNSPEEWKRVREARQKLGSNISWAFTWKGVSRGLGGDAKAQKRLALMGKIQGQLQRALSGFEGDPMLQTLIDAKFGINEVTGSGLSDLLDEMRRLSDILIAARSAAPTSGLNGEPQGQQRLFSLLAKAYREGIEADPATDIAKTYRDYHGPFVAFVHAAFHLAGQPSQTGEALTKALQRHILNPCKGQ